MSAFTGTLTLLRLILRRDRLRIPIWLGAITLVMIGTAATFPGAYPTLETRQERAELIANPATALILGPGFGIEDYTFGAMLSNEMLGLMCVVVALMSMLLVVRHTRAEEESERLELVRASMVGRHASLSAALLVVVAVNLTLAVILAAVLPATLEELAFEGSLLFGAALAATGVVFASVAAVMVQLNTFARAATGFSGMVLAVAYVVRGFGDVQENALSWLSPIGWAQQTAPYVLDRWWPLALSLLLSAALAALAYALSVRRDVGAGLLPPRPGPASASPALGHPLGLALRLQRGSLIGWTAGLTLFAFGTGTMVSDVAEMYETNPVAQDYLTAMGLDQSTAVEATLALYVSFAALFAAIFTVGAVTKLRAEESAGHTENVQATAVSRQRWAGAFLGFSVLATTGIMALAGLSSGLGYAVSAGDASDIPRVLGAALAYTPALWVAAGVALAVYGLVPGMMVLAWTVPAVSLFMLMLGPLLGLPDWMYELSPFEHVPRLPVAELSLLPLVVMTAIATALTVGGLVGYRRRDLAT